jgi:hypothetical protein
MGQGDQSIGHGVRAELGLGAVVDAIEVAPRHMARRGASVGWVQRADSAEDDCGSFLLS